jgi:tRNA dimethylallyltransferase
MGPTACGKTALAVELHAQLPVEIISVDSALVYRGMDIGTAKPDAALRARAPHRLVDVCDPEEPYSAARFRDDALSAMAEITQAGRIPLLVGGTMLYFRALEFGLSELPQADAGLRAQIEARARREGWASLHAELSRIDPEAGARIHPNDPQRLQRALEVHALTGRPISELQGRGGPSPLAYRLLRVGLMPQDRAALRQRIATRLETMLGQGLLDEVRRLSARPGLSPDSPALRSVGYRQLLRHLRGDCGLEEAAAAARTATAQLAKRQMTWLRHYPEVELLAAESVEAGMLVKLIRSFVGLQ